MTGFKGFRIKKRRELHGIFAMITFILVLVHVLPFILPSKVLIPEGTAEGKIKLPEPRLKGEMSLEEAILKRRSIRDYEDEDLSLEQLSQILWAAQGITGEGGKRAAPSAGMTYPLELYVLVRKVEGVEKGVYHYNPQDHSLELVKPGDYSDELMRAAINQRWVRDGSVNIIVTADFWRTMSTYGERGRRYVYLEAGHAAQNVYLQVTALRLGCVVIGAFSDEEVKSVLSLPQNHEPIYVIPIGHPI
jgi:SagB-type dehydrogenase family enzyme